MLGLGGGGEAEPTPGLVALAAAASTAACVGWFLYWTAARERRDREAVLQRQMETREKQIQELLHSLKRAESRETELRTQAERARDQGVKMQQDAPVSRGDIFLRLNRLLLLKDDAAWGLPEAREFVREAQQ